MGIVNSIIILLSGLAVLYFVWGMVTFISKSGDEKERTEGKQKMIWGLIALFVIVAMWGIVAVLRDTFLGGSYGSPPPPPQFPVS